MNRQNGFSLIQIAIFLIVIGLIAPVMLQSYNQYVLQAKRDETRATFSDIKTAINTFVAIHGRYPIPASLKAKEGDDAYGEEGVANPPSCSSSGWFNAKGMCRTASSDGVLIGAVPFAALTLDTEAGQDDWKNKIIYAVTTTQTIDCDSVPPATPCFDQSAAAGRISVWSYNAIYNPGTEGWDRQPPIEISSTYDMVLVSPGETRIGAYNLNSVLIEPCDQATPTLESENCDFDNTFFLSSHPTPSIQNTGARSLTPGTEYYDDMTDAQDSFPLGTWFENSANINYLMTLSDRIGIGTTLPEARIHVEGDMQAGKSLLPANIETDWLCDDGAACFRADLIGGYDTDMNCEDDSMTGNQPVIEIGESHVFCGAPVDASGNVIDTSVGGPFQFSVFDWTPCPPGELMTGIDATGAIQCAFVP